LLANSTHSVEQIGEKCGFNSTEHFIRLFRKYMGCSPSRFRKKNQKANSKLETL
jgi:AraC-like DNA-binding protein